MDSKMLQKLLKRIGQEPSVLFLGQNYLAGQSGKNLFAEIVYSQIGINSKMAPDYNSLWKMLCADTRNGSLSTEQVAFMEQAVRSIPQQRWLRKVMSLKWSTIYTSSVDDAMTRRVGDNFAIEPVTANQKAWQRKYANKEDLHCIYLFGRLGDEQAPIPLSCSRKDMLLPKRSARELIRWIRTNILTNYGLLVIDGWESSTDWISETDLLEDLVDLPKESIFLFGAPKEIPEDSILSYLNELGIIVMETNPLVQVMNAYGFLTDTDDETYNDFFEADNDALYRPVTLRLQGRPETLRILVRDISLLGNNVQILDDTVAVPSQIVPAKRALEFARFLTKDKLIWGDYFESVKFYFTRDKDVDLYKAVQNAPIGKSSLVLLEGPSNSGKSEMLANLALRLKLEQEHPVLYLTNKFSVQHDGDKLKSFIKEYFNKYRGKQGGRIKHIIVIWDGVNNLVAGQKYVKLKDLLAECNVIIVGSKYSTEAKEDIGNKAVSIPVDSNLSSEEAGRLEAVINSLGSLYEERYHAIKKEGITWAKRRYRNGNQIFDKIDNVQNILVILPRMFEFEYKEEFRQVRRLMERRQKREINITETATQDSLNEYAQSFFRTYDEILNNGAFTEWQLKLQNWLEANKKNDKKDSSVKVQKEKMLHMEGSIHKINSALAIAGQFSFPLPLSLILRLIGPQYTENQNFYGDESRFIMKVLREDSLVRYSVDNTGYALVAFRHSTEAEMYLQNRFVGCSEDERREKEVCLLCELINTASFNLDNYEFSDNLVIELARQFGPNSRGLPSKPARGDGHYSIYKKQWKRIAQALLKNARSNPDAIRLYAHFTRESDECTREELERAQDVLRDAINVPDLSPRDEINLLTELCANLVSSSQRYADASVMAMYNEVCESVFKIMGLCTQTDEGSLNNLLDIRLRAFITYDNFRKEKGIPDNDKEFQTELSNAVEIIDRLFTITSELSSTRLVEKIENVYKYLNTLEEIARLSDGLCKNNNDTYLYLCARRLWLTGRVAKMEQVGNDRWMDIVQENLFFLPSDLSDEFEVDRTELKDKAQKVVSLLEERNNYSIIQRSLSLRCLSMLIRAKWIIASDGHLPLEEGQMVGFTKSEWDSLGDLAGLYIQWSEPNSSGVGSNARVAYFIRATYLWLYSCEISRTTDLFHILRKIMTKDWYIDRLILCHEGTTIPRKFKVDIVRNNSEKLVARITEEVDAALGDMPLNTKKPYIHVSARMLDYLYGKVEIPKPKNGLSTPCTLRFSSAGALLGEVPAAEGGV